MGKEKFFKSRIFRRKYPALKPLNDWLQENPEETLKNIYMDNFSWMERYVLQNSGNSDDARDVFQESISAAWLNFRLGRFKGNRDQFNAYIRQICKYKWINELRSGNRKRMVYSENLPDAEVETFNANEHQLEQTSILNSCMSRLGEKCRKILGLFYYKKKSLATIAANMGNTEESIKTIKYRCMMQLRKLYLEETKRNGAV